MLRKTFAAFAVSAVVSIGWSGAASAADLYAPSIKDEQIERSFSWTGVTVGAHGGYQWGDGDFPDAPAYIPPPLNGRPSGPPNPELEGGLLGLQVGYNHQFGKLVVGVEADISFADIDDTVRDGNFITQTTEFERLGTVRAKLGYAHGSWLPYITGGYAWADVSYSQTCPQGAIAGHCSFTGEYTRSDDTTMSGWTLGGGIKYAINDHFILGAEYLHLEFDQESFDFGGPLGGRAITAADMEIEADIVKLAVDYKF